LLFGRACGKQKIQPNSEDQAQRLQAIHPRRVAVELAHDLAQSLERQVATATVAVVPEVTRGDQGLDQTVSQLFNSRQ